MPAPALRALVAALVVLLLAGCAGPAGWGALRSGEGEGDPGAWPRGVHPWPLGDGSEWPEGLEGPFALASLERHRVEGHDGVGLDGFVYLPAVPQGVKVPVVLWSSPYFGNTNQYADSPGIRTNDANHKAVPIDLLVENGYAVAAFNVRGTSGSGGCFEMFGPNEQKDQAILVEWLAAQPWSNGRVGMMGLSYHGTTPWEAAIHDPPALKTIVVAGMVADLYTFYHTPQGAAFFIGAPFQAAFDGLVSFLPPVQIAPGGGPAEHPERWTTEWLPVAKERFCPEVSRTVSALAGEPALDERDAAYWDARRLQDHFPDVRAAVLLTHGFDDTFGSGHQVQENLAWGLLDKAPKWQLEGQWGHEFPNFNTARPDLAMGDWNDKLLVWLDFWLKGVGSPPPRLGLVDFQDGTGAWHESTQWPPAASRDEVIHLSGGALSPTPAPAHAGAFVSRPLLDAHFLDALCPDVPHPGPVPDRLLYESPPLAQPVLLAGNPWALLRLESDAPGGLVSAYLYDLAPSFACVAGEPVGAALLSAGSADLRFHGGGFAAVPFPTGTPVEVRLDLTDLAEVVPAGHRLALAISHGDASDRSGQQAYAPRILVHEGPEADASHLVLPFLEGSLGGGAPIHVYPPRPFAHPHGT